MKFIAITCLTIFALAKACLAAGEVVVYTSEDKIFQNRFFSNLKRRRG